MLEREYRIRRKSALFQIKRCRNVVCKRGVVKIVFLSPTPQNLIEDGKDKAPNVSFLTISQVDVAADS